MPPVCTGPWQPCRILTLPVINQAIVRLLWHGTAQNRKEGYLQPCSPIFWGQNMEIVACTMCRSFLMTQRYFQENQSHHSQWRLQTDACQIPSSFPPTLLGQGPYQRHTSHTDERVYEMVDTEVRNCSENLNEFGTFFVDISTKYFSAVESIHQSTNLDRNRFDFNRCQSTIAVDESSPYQLSIATERADRTNPLN